MGKMALRRLTHAFKKSSKDQPLLIEKVTVDPEDDEVVKSKETSDVDVPKKFKKTFARIKRIGDHKRLAASIEDTKKRLSQYRAVLQMLMDVYAQTRADCPCCKYKALKNVALEAVKAYDKLSTTGEIDEPESAHLLSPIQRLLFDARRFSANEAAIAHQQIMYSELSDTALTREINCYEEEDKRLSNELSAECRKFENLRLGLSRLSSYWVLRRYLVLMLLIEEATADCLADS